MQDTSNHRKLTLSVCCTTHIVQDGLMSAIYVVLPILAQTFGLSYAQVGILKGLNNASQAIFELFSGWFAEKVSDSKLVAIGLAITGFGYICLSFSYTLFLIAICLVMVGIGTALHHAPSLSLVTNSTITNKRTSALGIYNASGDIGKLTFTGFFSLGIGAGLAWLQISFLYGLIAIAAALVITIVMRSILTESQSIKAHLNNDEIKHLKGWGILNWRSFTALLFATSIDTLVQTGILVFVAFLMLSKGLPLQTATTSTVILLAGGVFGKAGCGFLAERIGEHWAFILAQLLTALGLVVIILSPNWLALILLFPIGMVVQGSSSITYGLAANLIHPKKMARGFALLYSAGTFAAATTPFAFGWLADGFGINTAFYLMAAIILLSIPPIILLPKEVS